MIEKLTPKQEADLPIFRQEYLDIACGGKRADRAKLEIAFELAYGTINKEKPQFLLFDSPLSCLIVIAALENRNQLRSQLGNQLRSQLRNQLRSQLWDQLGSQLGNQLGSQLWDQLGDQLRSQLRNQLWGQLGSQLWDQLGDQLRSQLGDQLRSQLRSQLRNQLWGQLWIQLGGQLWGQLWDQLRIQLRSQLVSQLGDQLRSQLGGQNIYKSPSMYGSQELYWIIWGLFAEKIGVKIRPKTKKKLDIVRQIGEQCEWWWAYDNIVIASQRPLQVEWDENRRLHNEIGPAVSYADGFSLYSWRGLSVPKHWIEDRKNLDPAEVMKSKNVEQRAAGAEIVGWPKMLSVLQAKTVDQHSNPEIGELIELTLPGLDRPGRFLKAQCPRNGIIVEGVPYESEIDGKPIDTALAAQAWRLGDPQDDYIPPQTRT